MLPATKFHKAPVSGPPVCCHSNSLLSWSGWWLVFTKRHSCSLHGLPVLLGMCACACASCRLGVLVVWGFHSQSVPRERGRKRRFSSHLICVCDQVKTHFNFARKAITACAVSVKLHSADSLWLRDCGLFCCQSQSAEDVGSVFLEISVCWNAAASWLFIVHLHAGCDGVVLTAVHMALLKVSVTLCQVLRLCPRWCVFWCV